MKRILLGAAAIVVGLSPGLATSPARAGSGWAAGGFAGTIAYQGDGIPAYDTHQNGACRQTHFDTSLTAVVAVDYDGRAFRGPVGIVGGGGSGLWPGAFECEWTDLGSGRWQLSVPLTTDVAGNTLRCPDFYGIWTRIGAQVIAELYGTCEVNGVATDGLSLLLSAEWVPVSPGGGVVTDITDAVLTGVIAFEDDMRP